MASLPVPEGSHIQDDYFKKKRYKRNHTKESEQTEKRCAVHLELDLSAKSEGTLKWNDRGAFSSGDLRLSSDGYEIEVNRSGVYFLSPKVIFLDNKEGTGTQKEPMLLQVYKKSVSGFEPILLLEDRVTNCKCLDSMCNITSSTHGLFQFESGESVSVQVRPPDGLLKEEKLNQFDMYLI